VEVVPTTARRRAETDEAAHESAVEAVRALARASRILERSTGELSLAQYRVLAAVAGGDERASRIARRLALGKPTISATVDSLCQRGLVARGEVADDQRAAALSLTAQGKTMLRTVENTMLERLHQVITRLPDPTQVLSALVALGTAIDGYVDERAAQVRR
jgi:DNA-binding MarR family transcriptional regulator